MSELDARGARDLLVGDLNRFLVGPLEEQEVIPERASDRYHTGYLSPSGTVISPEEDDGLGAADEDHDDDVLVLANMRQQGAMGFTFEVDPQGPDLRVGVRWAEYDRSEEGAWARRPIERQFRLRVAGYEGNTVLGMVDGIEIGARIRLRTEACSVTVTVVNRRPEAQKGDREELDPKIYQVALEVAAEDGTPAFTARPSHGVLQDPEFWNFELLYRDVRSFAVGHGCSTGWDLSTDGRRAVRVYSRWIPANEVFKASADVMQGDPVLDLSTLSDATSRERVCDLLGRLPDNYDRWVEGLRASLEGIVTGFPEERQARIRDVANGNLAACSDASRRMRSGIAYLKENELAWKAFCLANEAMALSMRQARPKDEPRWRAFQLAFILMALESTAEPHHPDRGVLDLIWFPTGGGKTEAYLGLAAFAMIHRRLAHPGAAHGTAVFTRYTLRLLTIQQFERSARLLCACELLRQSGRIDGSTPFTIGLFVGGGATPNTFEEAAEILRSGDAPEGGPTTMPIQLCPWCGHKIDRHQEIRGGHLLTRCGNPACKFRGRLPVIFVDEELYAHPPAMVVATVDKFARMPWEPEIRKLFGIDAAVRPPDLIIQDELHLINDALGTMVALYETAIDHLCSSVESPPKIVGSTATIRRADRQVRGVFGRSVAQFPPSGLSMDDSFFYREDRDHPGRLYVGVHAQGRSPKHTLARVLGTLAQSSVQIEDVRLRDPYHTIVTYFNSLRELGGAWVLAEDDVRRYIDSMPVTTPLRYLAQPEELTSHLPSYRIPELFRRLATTLTGAGEGDDLDSEPVDLVFATNMISVGVDVDRLGLMVINGQPKTTAEYIQASSRIGRPMGAAGLVVTIYNWTRPRDRSHYERFATYHQAFYRSVEATSVTPFSARARDRALHAVLVSLARLGEPALVDNASAALLAEPGVLEQVRRQVSVVLRRAGQIDPQELDATQTDLERLLQTWRRQIDEEKLNFARRRNRPRANLLRSPEAPLIEGLWPTPQSMRDVDPPSTVRLLSSREVRSIVGEEE